MRVNLLTSLISISLEQLCVLYPRRSSHLEATKSEQLTRKYEDIQLVSKFGTLPTFVINTTHTTLQP